MSTYRIRERYPQIRDQHMFPQEFPCIRNPILMCTMTSLKLKKEEVKIVSHETMTRNVKSKGTRNYFEPSQDRGHRDPLRGVGSTGLEKVKPGAG